MLAGLVRALAHTCYQDAVAGRSALAVRGEMLKAAMWQSSRYGLGGELIDFERMQPISRQASVSALLEYVRPALANYGDESVVVGEVKRILAEGNSAQRQRQTCMTAKTLEGVVDDIVRHSSVG